MHKRRCSAQADVEQSDGGTLSARKPRDPLSSYMIKISEINALSIKMKVSKGTVCA